MDRIGKFLSVALLLCLYMTPQVAGQVKINKHGFGLSISVGKGNKGTPVQQSAPQAKAPAPAPAPAPAKTPVQTKPAASTPPTAPPGTIGKFRKHTKDEAIKARNRAKPGLTAPKWSAATKLPASLRARRGLLQADGYVCENNVNNLTPTNYEVHCRIISTYPDGKSGSCSATKMADDRLATAAHCIYSPEEGGFAEAIDVYCTGMEACQADPTTYGTGGIIAPRFTEAGDGFNEWDIAVIKTGDELPGAAFPLVQAKQDTTIRARTSGYPGDSDTQAGCDFSMCTQHSSSGNLEIFSDGFYYSTAIHACPGQSGSSLLDNEGGLIAVLAGGGPAELGGRSDCEVNKFVPNIAPNSVDANCEKSTGGASLECLSKKL